MAERVLGRFLDNSRRKVAFVNRVPVQMGKKAIPVEFPRVGFLGRIYLRLKGNLNIASGGSLGEKGIWHIFEKIGLKVNIQNAELVDISGWGAFCKAHFLERGFAPNVTGNFYKVTSAVGDNAIDVILPIQINANFANDAMAGLIPLHTEGLRTSLDLRFNDNSEIGTGCTFTGDVEVEYEYHESVNPNEVEEPSLVFIKQIETVQPIIAGGELIFPIPQMGILMSEFHYVTANNAISEAIEDLYIKVGRTETLTQESFALNRMRHRLNLGSNLPKGLCGWNFFHSYQRVSEGSLREALDTEDISELEAIVRTEAGIVLGQPGTNYLTTIRTILQPGVETR
jgi:hypothetical protein